MKAEHKRDGMGEKMEKKKIVGRKKGRKKNTSDGTRTRNPRLRRPMPYPLGYGGLREVEVEYYIYQGEYARFQHPHRVCRTRKH